MDSGTGELDELECKSIFTKVWRFIVLISELKQGRGSLTMMYTYATRGASFGNGDLAMMMQTLRMTVS